MSGMVQATVAGDVTEAEEIQALLTAAGWRVVVAGAGQGVADAWAAVSGTPAGVPA